MKNKKGLQAILILVLIVFGPAILVRAQGVTPSPKPQEVRPSPAADIVSAKEDSSVTEHAIRIKGQVIPYRATAGTTLLRDDKGEPTGLMYAVAYTRSDVKDLSARPIAFFYNGGPGSASM